MYSTDQILRILHDRKSYFTWELSCSCVTLEDLHHGTKWWYSETSETTLNISSREKLQSNENITNESSEEHLNTQSIFFQNKPFLSNWRTFSDFGRSDDRGELITSIEKHRGSNPTKDEKYNRLHCRLSRYRCKDQHFEKMNTRLLHWTRRWKKEFFEIL